MTTEPLVTVRGEAILEVSPDRATLSVTGQASGKTAEAVRTRLAEISRELSGLVAAHSAAVVEHGTTGVHIGPTFDERRPPRVAGYSGSVSASVVVADFDVLPHLLAALADRPDCSVDGPWWSLSPGHPSARAARIAAVADARGRALDYAAAVEHELGSLVEISDLEPGGRPSPMVAASRLAKFESAPAFDLVPTPQTVTGQVVLRFTLRPPAAGPASGRVSEQ